MPNKSYSVLLRCRWLSSLALVIVVSQLPLLAVSPPIVEVYDVQHTFNPGSAIETSWRIRAKAVQCEKDECRDAPQRGLYIVWALFKPGPVRSWIQVLGETGISEIYVNYHDLRGNIIDRIYDLKYARLARTFLQERTTPENDRVLGPNGSRLGLYIVKEIRERGLAWLKTEENRAMRGQELMLWAILNNGNYDYLEEFSFRDDGSIACRVGSTGYLNTSHAPDAHVHNFLWRVDVDLDGPESDVVLISGHEEPSNSLQAFDRFVLFNRGFEGCADWSDRQFTELTIFDQLTRINGKLAAYDLKPLRRGTSRHWSPSEEFSLHDFWVTRFHPGELRYQDILSYLGSSRPCEPSITAGESIRSTNVVIWYNSPMHHLPRDEDNGAMPVVWTGFELTPRGLAASNPLFQP